MGTPFNVVSGAFDPTMNIGGARFQLPNNSEFSPVGMNTQNYNVVSNLSAPPGMIGNSSTTQQASGGNVMTAMGNPLSLESSPLPWIVLALVVGSFAFYHLSWKD